MGKGRLEAFSDGVIAIIITIMVLELKVPHEPTFAALGELLPIFLSYVLSFVYIGIYWNNHHHMLHLARSVNGRILWANLHLLFWLSLVPFVTDWMGENHLATAPVALYGVLLDLCGLSYYILSRTLIAHLGQDSELAVAVGADRKGILSLVIYTVGIVVAFFNTWVAFALYVVVALMWFIPDSRIERLASSSERKT